MLKKCAALVAAAGLVVTVACAQTDSGITTSVKTKMAADDTVKAYQIDVDTANGVVTLSGVVDTAAAKGQAVTLVRGTSGVRDVVDRIEVDARADAGERLENQAERGAAEANQEGRELGREIREEAGQAGRAVGDAAITTAVKTKFLADATVKGLQMDVDTSNGVVTLNGSVASRAEADRAMMLARNTEGVKSVVNNLKVR